MKYICPVCYIVEEHLKVPEGMVSPECGNCYRQCKGPNVMVPVSVLDGFKKSKKKSAKVIPIGTITLLDLDPDEILEAAKNTLDGVILIGFIQNTKEVYAASSYADGGTVMWLLEACKTKMMDSV